MRYLFILLLIITLTSRASAQSPCGAAGFGDAGSAACGNVGTGGSIRNKCSDDGLCNVLNFGAVPDGAIGNTDNTPFFQAAYNAACAINGSVYIPATYNFFNMNYTQTGPILDNCPFTVPFIGASMFQSRIHNVGGGPDILRYPSTYLTDLGTVTGTAINTGDAVSLSFPSSSKWYLNLNDIFLPQTLNGLTGFTYDAFLKWVPNGNHNYTVFGSGGNDGANPNAINYNSSNSLPHITVTVSGDGSGAGTLDFYMDLAGTITHLSVNGGSSTFTANATHVLEAVLDPNSGSPNICLFVDGVRVGTTAASGGTTINQLTDETVEVGAEKEGSPMWPDGSANNPWMGLMGSFQISKVARHTCGTTSYTAPTARFTADGNTLALPDLNRVGPVQSPATPLIRTITPSNGILVIRGTTVVTQGPGASVSNLQLLNGLYGVMTIAAPTSIFQNLIFSGAYMGSLYLTNNSYSSRADHIFTGQGNIAIATVNTSDIKLHEFQSTGDTYGLVGQTGGLVTDAIIAPSSGGLVGIDAGCGSATCSWKLNSVAMDVEAGGSAIGLKLWAGTQTGSFILEGSTDLQTAGSNPGVYINTFSNPGKMQLSASGVHFEGGTPSNGIFHCLTGTTANVNWVNPMINNILPSLNAEKLTDCPSWTVPGGTDAQTITGTTAGMAVWSVPDYSAGLKRFQVTLAGYRNSTGTAQTATLPWGFNTVGSVVTDSGSCTGVTISATTLTLPSSMGSTQTGQCEVVGY